jgi:hypothetical protein
MDTTTGAQTPTQKITDAQMRALHAMVQKNDPGHNGWVETPNRGVLNRLVKAGLLRERAFHERGPLYRVTDAGRAAHDAVYTADRLAAEAQARSREAKAARDAAQARRDDMDTAAELRTEDMAAVRDMLGDAAPWWTKGGAKPHDDYSGISGGDSVGRITATELRRYLEAALRNAGVQA